MENNKWWTEMDCRPREDRGEEDLTLQIEKLKKEIEELKAALAREKEDHQYDNLVHKRELADLFKGKYEKE